MPTADTSDHGLVIFLDVPLEDGTDRSELVEVAKSAITAELRDSSDDEMYLHGEHGNFWTPLSGEPGFDVPKFTGDVRPFVIGSVLAIAAEVGLAVLAQVAANRADTLLTKLAGVLPVRKRNRDNGVPDRDASLLAALWAIHERWPGTVESTTLFSSNPDHHLHMLGEGLAEGANWSFNFRLIDLSAAFTDPAGAPHYLDHWTYDVTVSAPATRVAGRLVEVYRRRNDSA